MELSKQHAFETSKVNTLLVERLEQLGYQCHSECCDTYTTLTIRPLDEKLNTEEFGPEKAFVNQIKEQHN